MKQEELNEVLRLHKLWIEGNKEGEKAILVGKDLRGLNLSDFNLSKADLTGANLYGAILTGANLYGANLTGADLYRAELSGAKLAGAKLAGADLIEAKLWRANLSGANLQNANLSGANLWRANLSGANLQGVILVYTNVSEVKGKTLASFQGIQGECGRQITVLAEGEETDWIIFCGCFTSTRQELEAWLNEQNREEWGRESTEKVVDFLFQMCRDKLN